MLNPQVCKHIPYLRIYIITGSSYNKQNAIKGLSTNIIKQKLIFFNSYDDIYFKNKEKTMLQTQACKFTNRYSDIEGFQNGQTVVYSAEAAPTGIRLSVKQEDNGVTMSESCLCPSLSFEYASSLLKYICENGVGIANWYDILQDAGILFAVDKK